MIKKTTVEHQFTGETVLYANYDSTKTTLGKYIAQYDGYAGPYSIGVARPGESISGTPCTFPHSIPIDSDNDYVYVADASSAGTTRRFSLYKYNKPSSRFALQGFITVTMPAGGNHTIRGFRALSYTYSTGTVAVSGTGVTGTGTAWQTARFATGARIGFGSTNPNDITTWYDITINSNTSITLGRSAGTISAGTPFVIQEHRLVFCTTSSVAANGGLFVVKGVSPQTFLPSGTSVPAATTVDNIRACYWLADAVTGTLTVSGGLGLLDRVSDTQHDILVLNGTVSAQIFKYNMRKDLTLSSGRDTTAFLFKTGAQTVTGTVSQSNNSRVATVQHGVAAGILSFYFVTTTRAYRSAVSNIIAGATNFLSDAMLENPPGSVNSFPASTVMSSIEYIGSIDRFVIMTTGAAGARNYVTRWLTSNEQFDHIFGIEDKQNDSSFLASYSTPHPTNNATACSIWVEDGMAYISRISNVSAANTLWAVPFSIDWEYANITPGHGRLISPAMPTPNASRLLRLHVQKANYIGPPSIAAIPEPFSAYIRTAGISDNSGEWIKVNDDFDLSGVTAGRNVQVMFEFRIIGLACIPARIYGCGITYEEEVPLPNYRLSKNLTDVANKRFAWKHVTAFGASVPRLKVKFYDLATNNLLFEDDTTSENYGVFEKTTNGGTSWGAWNNTDKANETTYIRYIPTTLPEETKLKVQLLSYEG